MPAKVKVFLVKPTEGLEGPNRLIRGTLKEVEQKLRGEVSIEPCDAATAHQMRDVAIEEAQA